MVHNKKPPDFVHNVVKRNLPCLACGHCLEKGEREVGLSDRLHEVLHLGEKPNADPALH